MSFRENLSVLGKTQKRKVQKSSIPIGKNITKIDKDGNEIVVTISYKIKFIYSARFMARSISDLVFTEGIKKIKWKGCGWFLEYESVMDNLMLRL